MDQLSFLELRRDRIWSAAVITAALVFAWLCTIPSAIALINWDNAAYIAGIASGQSDWSHLPWSSHLGIGQEYHLGTWLARALGGTVIDGFRVVNALFFAWTCWALFDTSRRLTASRVQAALLTALWATTWVNLHYHLILEDNFLFLAPCAAMLRICVLRADHWRGRDSIVCGALCLLGLLGSYQALPYIFTAGYAALWSPGRPPIKRGRDAVLVGVGFVGALLAWMVFTVSSSKLTWKVLSGQVLMGPVPNFIPRSPALLLRYIFDGHSVFETLGNGVVWNLSFHAYTIPWASPISRWTLGLLATLLVVGLFVYAARWSWRNKRLAPHLLTATLLLLTFATSIHRDEVEYTGLKRYDFVPLVAVLLLAFVLGELRKRPVGRTWVTAVVALMAVIIPTQLALGLRWTVKEQARYITTSSWNKFPHPEPMQYGREGQSWFKYFRGLERAHHDACTLVFSYGEMVDSAWNFDITGSLYSEVHSHLVVADDDMVRRFAPNNHRIVPHWVRAQDARISPCAWVSGPAAEVLSQVHR